MKLLSELKLITKELNNYPDFWALCGGVVASIYRASARFTDDIDIALVDSCDMQAKDIASEVLAKLNYKPKLGYIPFGNENSRMVYRDFRRKAYNAVGVAATKLFAIAGACREYIPRATRENCKAKLFHEVAKPGIFNCEGYIYDPKGSGEQVQGLLCGRDEVGGKFVGIDFLLPVFPWIEKAVSRAQENLLDYGFGKIPTITIEDLLIAKINAISSPSQRAVDIDDIKSIFEEQKIIDAQYIISQTSNIGIEIPDWVKDLLSEF